VTPATSFKGGAPPPPGFKGGAPPTPGGGLRVGYWRWIVCALLFFATTINYIDRQVLGILKTTLQGEFGWTEIDYSNIVFAFQLAYAVGLLLAGRLMDRLGSRTGFAFILIVWSLAAVAHAAAPILGGGPVLRVMSALGITASASVAGFILVRFALGLGEAGNFPVSIKTVAEWFPRKERAFATGIFNSGTNVGALLTPLVVPWVTFHYGWQWAFVITGLLGLVWLVFWLPLYRPPEEHPRLSKTELAYIRSDPPEQVTPIRWTALFPHRQTWAFAAGKFMTDPIWWVYLFWLPDFLQRNHGVDLKNLGLPVVVVYLIADVGSIGGGWISSTLIKRGWSVNAGRKTAMLICALAVTPIVFASRTQSMWLAVGLVGLAAAAHQGWSANMFTLVSDMFPRRAVGSVVGIGGMAGAIGGMLIAKVVGWVLQSTGSYVSVFLIAASAYLMALLVVHLLAPRLAPARVD
jgi:ACS family hexuronate transporter-like MFS transporter